MEQNVDKQSEEEQKEQNEMPTLKTLCFERVAQLFPLKIIQKRLPVDLLPQVIYNKIQFHLLYKELKKPIIKAIDVLRRSNRELEESLNLAPNIERIITIQNTIIQATKECAECVDEPTKMQLMTVIKNIKNQQRMSNAEIMKAFHNIFDIEGKIIQHIVEIPNQATPELIQLFNTLWQNKQLNKQIKTNKTFNSLSPTVQALIASVLKKPSTLQSLRHVIQQIASFVSKN
jgi:hypothetical protein